MMNRISINAKRIIFFLAIVSAWFLVLSVGSIFESFDERLRLVGFLVLIGGVIAVGCIFKVFGIRLLVFLEPNRSSNFSQYSLKEFFGSIFHQLFVGSLIIFLATLCFNYPLIWVLSDHRIPPLSLFPLMLLCVLVIVIFEHSKSQHIRPLGNLCAATLLALVYSGVMVEQLGDGTWYGDAMIPELFASSIFAHLILYLVHINGLGLDLVAPFCGFLTSLLFFSVCDYVLKDINWFGRVVGKLCYLGSGIHLVFFFGYVEVTMIALPTLLLFMYFLLKYMEGNEPRLPFLLLASCFLVVSALTHGQATFLFPAIPLLVIWKNGYVDGWKRSLNEISVAWPLWLLSPTWVYGY